MTTRAQQQKQRNARVRRAVAAGRKPAPAAATCSFCNTAGDREAEHDQRTATSGERPSYPPPDTDTM